MKQADLDKAILNVPVYTAQFRVIKLTPWHESIGYKLGDLLLLATGGNLTLISQRGINGGTVPCKPSFVEFVNYVLLDKELLRQGIHRQP